MKNKLYTKLFLYCVSIVILSSLLIGVVIYQRSSHELDNQLDRHMSQIVQNALNHTDLYLESYDRTMISLLTNRDLKKFIDLPSDADDYDRYSLQASIKSIAFTPIMDRNPELISMYALSFEGNTAYSFSSDITEPSFTKEAKAKQLSDLQSFMHGKSGLMINTTTILPGWNGKVIRMARPLKSLSTNAVKGFMVMEVRSQELAALWRGIDLGDRGYFYIMDDQGNTIYQPQELLDNEASPAQDKQLTALIGQADEKIFKYTTSDEEERVFMTRNSTYSGWRLVASMPLAEWRKPVDNIRSTVWTIGLFSILIASLLAYRFARSITQPIQTIIHGMRQTEQGRWVSLPMPKRNDEISEMMRRYNLMVTRLSELIDRVYAAELKEQQTIIERQKAEYQALQLQINPHFMYNTLGTIVCYAEVEGSEDITEMVASLAYMLRYSLQTTLEEITIANELNHVLNYMIIMKHRHDIELELRVEVPPEWLLYKMVRLTLQPLIENAFQHAFPRGIEPHHFVTISASCDESYFRVSIADNGIGMSVERLQEIQERLVQGRLAEEPPPSSGFIYSELSGGIGLLNVHRRIQLVFGEQYGLQIDRLEQGTMVTMVMPLPTAP
ncbi:MAG: sensor histidine kinase [Candidatus Pristimantibacillus sp.]